MTAALEGGEWSAACPGRTLPPGKTWFPFYRRLGGSQRWSGRAENLVVGKIQEIVDGYEKRLQEMTFIPRGSFRRWMLRQDVGPNRDFLTYLFCDNGLARHFLKDVGLLRSKVKCNTCDGDMTWSTEPGIREGFRWRCRRKVAAVKCSASRSIRTGS